MTPEKIGIREFRAGLADYIASETPVAITRHGHTVGYFIPAQAGGEADLAALKRATQVLDRLLATQTVDVEEVVEEFKAARKQASALTKRRTTRRDVTANDRS